MTDEEYVNNEKKRRIVNVIIIALAVILTIFYITGCGSSNEEYEEEPEVVEIIDEEEEEEIIETADEEEIVEVIEEEEEYEPTIQEIKDFLDDFGLPVYDEGLDGEYYQDDQNCIDAYNEIVATFEYFGLESVDEMISVLLYSEVAVYDDERDIYGMSSYDIMQKYIECYGDFDSYSTEEDLNDVEFGEGESDNDDDSIAITWSNYDDWWRNAYLGDELYIAHFSVVSVDNSSNRLYGYIPGGGAAFFYIQVDSTRGYLAGDDISVLGTFTGITQSNIPVLSYCTLSLN